MKKSSLHFKVLTFIAASVSMAMSHIAQADAESPLAHKNCILKSMARAGMFEPIGLWVSCKDGDFYVPYYDAKAQKVDENSNLDTLIAKGSL